MGSCIPSGWRGFLVLLVWSLVMGVIGGVCGALPLIGGLLSTLWTICCLYLGMVVSVATLRATIYQKVGAGSWKNLVELGRRDPSGLLSILGWEMLLPGDCPCQRDSPVRHRARCRAAHHLAGE